MKNLKSIFITGAAGGMGRSTAKFFLEKNWFVGCFDNNEENLLDLENELIFRRIIVSLSSWSTIILWVFKKFKYSLKSFIFLVFIIKYRLLLFILE